MTVGELKALLEGHDDEVELRIATQPSYPFEHRVGPLCEVGVNDERMQEIQQFLGQIGEDKPTEAERVEAEAELSRLNAENQMVVYIGCGSQIGYLSGDVRDGLMSQGWYN